LHVGPAEGRQAGATSRSRPISGQSARARGARQ